MRLEVERVEDCYKCPFEYWDEYGEQCALKDHLWGIDPDCEDSCPLLKEPVTVEARATPSPPSSGTPSGPDRSSGP